MQLSKQLLLGPAILLIALAGSNFGFFKAQFSYFLAPPPQEQEVQAVAASNQAKPTSSPNILDIPSLGIKAPLIYTEKKGEAVFQAALKQGVVHYPGTALPGQLGNTYIFGHSSDYAWSKSPYRNVFALLTRIKVGALINVSDAQGNLYTYRVTGTKVVSPKDLSVLDQQGNKKKMLTLQTSYPLGTALKRFIVNAELVGS